MAKNILIIRRDNIGDLVCTTPLIRNLRKAFPDACIDVLVNSYNAPVLENNPDINQAYIYKKAKHRAHGESLFSVYYDRCKTYLKLRVKGVDIAILGGVGYNKRALRVAKIVGAKNIIGYASDSENKDGAINTVIPCTNLDGFHEVELINRLGNPLGVDSTPPKCSLIPNEYEVKRVHSFLADQGVKANAQPMGMHISARKPSNRWTEDNYVGLINRMSEKYHQPVILFWSPGSKDNPLHPGDDELAEAIRKRCQNIKLLPFPTQQLEQLIAGVSVCKSFVCSDGGAMHIASATGCPVLCFFGNSDAKKWYPWGTTHRLIQKKSLEVADISVEEAFSELNALIDETSGD